MTKRKADVDAPSSDWLREQLAALPRGSKIDLFGHTFWPEEICDPQCKPWLEMCKRVDDERSLQPLLELLKSQGVMPAKALPYVEDVFDSYQLRKKRGKGRRIPLYKGSLKRATNDFASKLVSAFVEGRMGHPPMKEGEAIELVAEAFKLKPDFLDSVYHGEHGGMRRLKQRAKRA